MNYLFLATGFEETEAVSVIDVLRRADMPLKTVSITKNLLVDGAHGVTIKADVLFEDINMADADFLILPGGMPGTKNLEAHAGLSLALKKHFNEGKNLAAICAAPSIYGKLGFLRGRKAISYPGFEQYLDGAEIQSTTLVEDGNIITAAGPGVTLAFGLKIVEHAKGANVAASIAKAMIFK
ncbi:MAG: DJ-1/PfpI family protein [Bacteroidia bacterium]|nr:DJ-1/PfpI family protein [Bacteroidia bacterium]